jgi:hypothetical protein
MFPLYALAPGPLALAAVAAAESVVAPVYLVAMSAHQLSITPDELRGRVAAATSTLTTGALSAGTLAGGFLLTTTGTHPLVWASSAWLAALALLTTANPAVRGARATAGAGPSGGPGPAPRSRARRINSRATGGGSA